MIFCFVNRSNDKTHLLLEKPVTLPFLFFVTALFQRDEARNFRAGINNVVSKLPEPGGNEQDLVGGVRLKLQAHARFSY